jgi:cytochrome P450
VRERPTVFDPMAPSFRIDPYPALHKLREAQSRYPSPGFGLVLTGYDDVAAALRHPDLGTGRRFLEPRWRAAFSGPALQYMLGRLHHHDPPEHTALRAVGSRAFTPKRVEGLRPWIEATAERLLDAADPDEPWDVLAGLGQPLPSLVISELLGIPPGDRHLFEEWTPPIAHLIAYVLDPALSSPELLARGSRATAEAWAYVEDLIDERTARPAGGMFDALVAAQRDGLSRRDLVAFTIFLFSAGHQTTRDSLGMGLLGLARHPDQWRLLVGNPALAADAALECLRYDATVPLLPRRALRDTPLLGADLAAGDAVVCAIAAANRDPARFPDPDAFRLARPHNQPLTFGGGIHHCLGAPLARLELEIVLRALARRYPTLRVAAEPSWRDSLIFRGPNELSITR